MIPSPHPLTPEVNLEMSGSHMVNMNYVQMNTKKEKKNLPNSLQQLNFLNSYEMPE